MNVTFVKMYIILIICVFIINSSIAEIFNSWQECAMDKNNIQENYECYDEVNECEIYFSTGVLYS